MFRRTVVALLTLAAVGLAAPTMALARGGGGGSHGGGFGGGGFHGGGSGGGGFHGGGLGGGGFRGGGMAAAHGFHGGQFGGSHDRGFHDHDFGHRRFAFGPGFDAYDYYDPYTYDDSYYDNGSCYVVQRRVHTTHGWRLQPVQVCD